MAARVEHPVSHHPTFSEVLLERDYADVGRGVLSGEFEQRERSTAHNGQWRVRVPCLVMLSAVFHGRGSGNLGRVSNLEWNSSVNVRGCPNLHPGGYK